MGLSRGEMSLLDPVFEGGHADEEEETLTEEEEEEEGGGGRPVVTKMGNDRWLGLMTLLERLTVESSQPQSSPLTFHTEQGSPSWPLRLSPQL